MSTPALDEEWLADMKRWLREGSGRYVTCEDALALLDAYEALLARDEQWKRETRYRMEDGSLIWGEYGWVHDPDFFYDGDTVRVVAEVYEMRLVERRVEVHGSRPLCPLCEGDGDVPTGEDDRLLGAPDEVLCPDCNGTGDGPETPYVVSTRTGAALLAEATEEDRDG